MMFAANTHKVRRITGPKNELEGLRKEHTLLIDASDGPVAIIRSPITITWVNAYRVTGSSSTLDLTKLNQMTRGQLENLHPNRIGNSFVNGMLYGLSIEMSDGQQVKVGKLWYAKYAELPVAIRAIEVTMTKN